MTHFMVPFIMVKVKMGLYMFLQKMDMIRNLKLSELESDAYEVMALRKLKGLNKNETGYYTVKEPRNNYLENSITE